MATIYHLGGYGSGKTYYALRLGIYEELVNGSRGIVTNVALLQEKKVKGKTVSGRPGLGSLNELLNARFKNLDARVIQRVRILTEDEVPHFFCHRISRGGLHYDIPVPSDEQEKRGARPDFSLLRDDGCVFVLDEFHDYFNARLWAEVGRSVGWYKNQQRKLNDDIHACTPQIDEVDKQLRTIGHEYRVYNNLGLRKVRGVVMPQTFICSVFTSLDSVKRRGQPLTKFPFTLDLELANCYDTAKGVRGLQGSSADIGKRPKGIHWAIPVAAFVAFVVGIIFLGYWVPRHHWGAKKHLAKPSSIPSSSIPSSSIPSSSILPPVPLPSPIETLPKLHDSITGTEQLFCTGYTYIGGVGTAFLSDGTSYSSEDHEIDWIQKRRVSILGKVYPVKQDMARLMAVRAPEAPNFPSGTPSQPFFNQQDDVGSSSTPQNNVFVIPNRSVIQPAHNGFTSMQGGQRPVGGFPQTGQ